MISDYDRNLRIGSKPPGRRLRRAVGQHFDDFTPFEVDMIVP